MYHGHLLLRFYPSMMTLFCLRMWEIQSLMRMALYRLLVLTSRLPILMRVTQSFLFRLAMAQTILSDLQGVFFIPIQILMA